MERGLVSAFVVAAGIAAAGWFIGNGFVAGRAADRVVSVKGVAEREVKADLALWPIRFVAADDDLGRAQARISDHAAKVRAFLQINGIDPANTELQAFNVTDSAANIYGGDRRDAPRYVISQTLMVRSDDPEVIFAASQKVSDLVNAGVVLSTEGGPGGGGPTYLFTKLNDLKPSMIAEATASARQAAEQFAKDSRSVLGGIRQASQGVFVILPRDQVPGEQEERQRDKIVRVVSTIEYYLRD
jgi:hypothetical protein